MNNSSITAICNISDGYAEHKLFLSSWTKHLEQGPTVREKRNRIRRVGQLRWQRSISQGHRNSLPLSRTKTSTTKWHRQRSQESLTGRTMGDFRLEGWQWWVRVVGNGNNRAWLYIAVIEETIGRTHAHKHNNRQECLVCFQAHSFTSHSPIISLGQGTCH